MEKDKLDAGVEKLIAKKPEKSKEMFFMLRDLVFEVSGDIEEKKKWSMPHYDYKGIMLGIGLFKNHASIWFHKGALMKDPKGFFKDQQDKKEMKQIKFHSPAEIDKKTIKSYIKEAVAINEKGLKVDKSSAAAKKVDVPADLEKALEANKKAKKNFDNFAYTYRKEYVNWVKDAKRESTREKRIKETVSLAEQNKKSKY